MPSVFAIVVTYQPDPIVLMRLLDALCEQVEAGVVVHNGATAPLPLATLEKYGFAFLPMDTNLGLASALNAGFEWAGARGAEFTITFDQDSEPAPEMVSRLLHAWQGISASGQVVGAVGPQVQDSRTGRPAAFLAPIRWVRTRLHPLPGQIVEVDHLITSGCLSTVAAWRKSGGFLDALFIDYVDIEWNLRLRHAGMHVYGVGGALLYHAMGDAVKDWRGQQIPQHSALRHYYLLRNGAYLQSLGHIPWAWRASDAFVMLKKFVYFALNGRPRWQHITAMLRGLFDGLRGRLGAARDSSD